MTRIVSGSIVESPSGQLHVIQYIDGHGFSLMMIVPKLIHCNYSCGYFSTEEWLHDWLEQEGWTFRADLTFAAISKE